MTDRPGAPSPHNQREGQLLRRYALTFGEYVLQLRPGADTALSMAILNVIRVLVKRYCISEHPNW